MVEGEGEKEKNCVAFLSNLFFNETQEGVE